MIDTADVENASKILPHLAAFVAVVDCGSYSGAARRLGVDKTLLSRRVMTLERALGVRLLHRTTRSISPTEAGRRLHQDSCGPLRETIAALLGAGEATEVEGTVRVASLPMVAADVWGPAIAALRQAHPRLQLELRAGDSYIDLVGEGMDLALRSGHMRDSSLVARRLGTWGYVLCASPEWLKRNQARVRHPADIKDDWVLYGSVARASRWRFVSGPQSHDVEVRPLVTIDGADVQQQLIATGVGVGALPAPLARAGLETGRLVRVLPRWRIEHDHGLWVVLPSRAQVPLRVRAVVEALTRQVAIAQPHWDAVAAAMVD